MDMDQSAVFLAGSILTALGFLVFVIAIVAINNIIHKFWKPISIVRWIEPPKRFITDEELESSNRGELPQVGQKQS